jgi:hypothetical protein
MSLELLYEDCLSQQLDGRAFANNFEPPSVCKDKAKLGDHLASERQRQH